MRDNPFAPFFFFAAVGAVLIGASVGLLRAGGPPVASRVPPLVRSSGLHIIVQELRGPTTLLWQAPVGSPDQRTVLAPLSHREGFGPRAALSPNGRILAVTLLPPDAGSPDLGAQLAIIDLPSGEQRTLAEGVDLRGAPVWSQDGSALAVRRWDGDVPVLVVLGTDGGERSAVSWPGALHLSAVGWDARGRLLAAAMLPHGFDLVAPLTGDVVARLSAGPARDFRLSPDGQRLAYLTDAGPDGAALRMVDLIGQGRPLTWERIASDMFGAVWRPDGQGLALSAEAGGGPLRWQSVTDAAAGAYALTAPAEGLAVPVAAGPDGWLAVRRLDGPDPLRPRTESLWIHGPAGGVRVAGDGPLEFVGWRLLP